MENVGTAPTDIAREVDIVTLSSSLPTSSLSLSPWNSSLRKIQLKPEKAFDKKFHLLSSSERRMLECEGTSSSNFVFSDLGHSAVEHSLAELTVLAHCSTESLVVLLNTKNDSKEAAEK